MTQDFYCDEVLNGRTPVQKVSETENVLAFHHTRPYYPVHIVVIPKRHIASLIALESHDDLLLLELFAIIKRIVAQVVAEANQNGASIEHKIYEEAGHDLSYAPKEIPRILEDMVGKWKRDMALASLDWSTDSPAMGRRAWLEITELADLGDLNAKDLKATPRSGQARVVLGITMNPELDVTDPVVVDSVAKDSVAEAMGIKAGDVIVGLDKAKIGNLNDLRAALARKKAGDDVEVEIERDGKSQTLKGKFPQAKSSSGQLMARIKASTRTVKGERGMERHFELLAANAGKLTLFLTADDVAAGRLSVSINGKAMTFDGLAHDAAFILSEFERTGDRKLPYVARLHIDVAVALKGAK